MAYSNTKQQKKSYHERMIGRQVRLGEFLTVYDNKTNLPTPRPKNDYVTVKKKQKNRSPAKDTSQMKDEDFPSLTMENQGIVSSNKKSPQKKSTIVQFAKNRFSMD